MEWFEYIKEKWNLDLIIIMIVFLSGFFQEKYMCKWEWKKDSRYDASLKTLAVSLIISSIYILVVYRETKRTATDGIVVLSWGKYLISYFAATSLYDMAIRPLRKWLKKKFGDDSPDVETTKP